MLARKGVMFYDYFDDFETLKERNLPTKEEFFSELTQRGITNEEYEFAKCVFKGLECKNLGDYIHHYMKTDVFLLADVFENFRQMVLRDFGLDPCYYITSPSLFWDAFLKGCDTRIAFIKDSEENQFIRKCVRGGISQIVHRRAEVKNNKTEIVYLDANSLYPTVMRKPLPFGSIERMDDSELTTERILGFVGERGEGCFVECDLEIPEELHDFFSDFPPIATRRAPPGSTFEKLIADLLPKKNYICHYEAFAFFLKWGVKCTKIHSAWKFEEGAFMREYIDGNIEKRNKAKEAKNAPLSSMLKLASNAIYGKTIEDKSKRIDLRLVTSEDKERKFLKLTSKPNFKDITIFDENLAAVQMLKTEIEYDKPCFIGAAILDLAKVHLLSFFYFLKKKFGTRVTLLFTDTDSLCFRFDRPTNEEGDPISFYGSLTKKERNKYLDLSSLPKTHQFFSSKNKGECGFFKDEFGGKKCVGFVGLRAKAYAFKFDDDSETTKAKGCQKSIRIKYENYIVVQDKELVYYKEARKFANKDHVIHTEVVNKKVLDSSDDKRFVCEDGIKTLPWGHKDIPQEK